MPPLELTGERTLPDVPEENYWYRRHLAVYEWIAERCRRAARSPTSPAARATARTSSRDRGRGHRGRRQPRGPRARPAALPAAEPALRARPGRGVRPSPCDAIVFLQTIEHIHEPGRAARAASPTLAPVAYVSTPEPADPGAARARRSRTTRGTCASTRAAEYRELLEPHFSRVEILGVFHARKLRAHELALRLGWDRVHRALRITKPFYDRFVPAISPADFALRAEAEATSKGARLRAPICRCAEAEQAAGGDLGDLAVVLHSHMPYVEGFGTYPFGEEWLFDAVVRSYLPVLEVARG